MAYRNAQGDWTCPQCQRSTADGARFHSNRGKPGGMQSYCTECQKIHNVPVQRRRYADPEYRRRFLNEQRQGRDRRVYGLLKGEYERLLAQQGGVCAICKRPPQRHRLHVDHDHKTGHVRGLLCIYCNQSLGAIENTVWVAAAQAYLRRYSSESLAA